MKSLSVFCLVLVGFLTLVSAVNHAFDLPYPVEVAQYTGTLGDHNVQLNGTIQMRVLYPNFDSSVPAAPSVDLDLTPRAAENKNGLLCIPVAGQSWARAYAGDIQTAVDALLNAGRIGVNGRTCVSFSCVGHCAFWLCNDNAYYINPSMAYLVTYAEDIFNKCKTNQNGQLYAGGQEFDSDNYNVIVRYDNC